MNKLVTRASQHQYMNHCWLVESTVSSLIYFQLILVVVIFYSNIAFESQFDAMKMLTSCFQNKLVTSWSNFRDN